MTDEPMEQLESGKRFVEEEFEKHAKRAGLSIRCEWGKGMVGEPSTLILTINGKESVEKFQDWDLKDAWDNTGKPKLRTIISDMWKDIYPIR